MLLNRKRAEEKMDKYGVKALVTSSPANVFYTSDLCPYGKCFTLLPREPNIEPALVAPISGPTPIVLTSPPWISDVRYYGEFYTETRPAKESLTDAERRLIRAQESWEKNKEADPVTLLIESLETRGITRGRVGVDESNLPLEHAFWREVKKRLPSLETVRAQEILREIRAVKSDEEIRRLQEALRITEKAWATALEQAGEGMTEREFGEIFEHTIISEGGRISASMGMYGPPIGFGRRTAFSDIASPSDYALEKGDLIRFDGGCSYMGYPCDTARSSVLGQPSQKLREYYEAILEGEQLAIDMAKPGVKASVIFNAVMGKVRKRIPHYRRHHTGHGWGIEGYDPPLIGPNVNTTLEEGMVLCLETPYYEVGWGGLMVEDVIVVTGGVPRFLTRFSRELHIVRG